MIRANSTPADAVRIRLSGHVELVLPSEMDLPASFAAVTLKSLSIFVIRATKLPTAREQYCSTIAANARNVI
jgi:hypothetical protein